MDSGERTTHAPARRRADRSWRDAAAWVTFPVLLGGFTFAAWWLHDAGVGTSTVVIGLTLANVALLVALEQVLPRKRDAQLFRDRQTLNDVGHGVLFTAIGRPLAAAIAVVVAVTVGDQIAGWWPILWPTSLPLVAQFGLALLVASLSDYWVHRSLHTFDRLWWFHSIHHDTPQMHVMKSGRLHIGEEMYNFFLKPLVLLALGAPSGILVAIGLYTVFDGNLSHSNVDQRFPRWAHYLLPTVQNHYVHHAADRRLQDSNYSGSLPLWDVVFGTYHHPDDHPVDRLGLADDYMPPGFLGQVLFPVRTLLNGGTPAPAVSTATD